MGRTVAADHHSAVSDSADAVRAGGVILYPTATVYGLGGDASSSDVADAINEIKSRPRTTTHLTLTDSWNRVSAWFGPRDCRGEAALQGRNRVVCNAAAEGWAGLSGASRWSVGQGRDPIHAASFL